MRNVVVVIWFSLVTKILTDTLEFVDHFSPTVPLPVNSVYKISPNLLGSVTGLRCGIDPANLSRCKIPLDEFQRLQRLVSVEDFSFPNRHCLLWCRPQVT